MTPTQLNAMTEAGLISPYGGSLINLVADSHYDGELWEEAFKLPSVQLSDMAVCDLELLATGAFSPLDRFMDRHDFNSVVKDMRLEDGTLFPIPVTLPVDRDLLPAHCARVALRDSRNNLLAVMDIDDVYPWDFRLAASCVFGTLDSRHPMVAAMRGWGRHNLSGELIVLRLPAHQDFRSLRLTPGQTRSRLEQLGRHSVVAFQSRNPMHRVHEEITRRAARSIDGTLFLHPVVGVTRPGDVDHYTRVRTFRALVDNHYDPNRTLLSLLPLAMRMAGPREALWHALIRRNYGANYLIVGRDHAGPGNDSSGRPFYGPDDALEVAEKFAQETGVTPVGFSELVYVPDSDSYEELSRVPADAKAMSLSGTEVREDYLEAGKPLPEWFTRPEVAEILSEGYEPRHRQGVCIWFTGLSGAGKSTTAEALTAMLMERGRRVTLLDGDDVRANLSKGLGFSREDRDANILRIGYVASEIVKHGGVAICAAISPYRAVREAVRNQLGTDRFVEVFVDTPLEVCEQRDSKGMYARARAGEITGFTGIDDPYEEPLTPEIALDTVLNTAESNALDIVDLLESRGFLKAGAIR